MAYRDSCTDDGRTGDGSKVLRGRDQVSPQDFSASTVDVQRSRGGWSKVNAPLGATPDTGRGNTPGNRGDETGS